MIQVKDVEVKEFRSILDNPPVGIDEDLTVLVGGNESGKSNFLRAIKSGGDRMYEMGDRSRLNEGEQKDVDDILVSFSCETTVVEIRDTLIENENLMKASADIFSIMEQYDRIQYQLGITHAGNLLITESEQEGFTEAAENSLRMFYTREYRDNLDEMVSRLREIEATPNWLDDRIDSLEDIKSDLWEIAENYEGSGPILPLPPHDDDGGLISAVHQLSEQSDGLNGLQQNAERVQQVVETVSSRGIPANPLIDALLPPIYFPSHPTLLRNSDDLDNPQSDVYSRLLEYSGLTGPEINEMGAKERRNRRKMFESNLDSVFNNLWTQSEVSFELSLAAGEVALHIHDESGDAGIDQPEDRSTGFRWFLSFVINLLYTRGPDFSDSVILLDDLGVHLHPEAHKDLLEVLEDVAEDNQVIYSTHSPYMIDKSHLDRVRIVERTGPNGATEVKKLGEANADNDDALAPIRATLGADFSQSLFGSNSTILVEGFEDRILLNRLSEYLRAEGRAHLEPEVSIIDCGGASKTDYLSRIVDAEGYDFVVLLDDDQAGEQAHENLTESKVEEDRIFFITNFLDREENGSVGATVEDLLPEEYFCSIAADVHDADEEELIDNLDTEHTKLVDAVKGELRRQRVIDPEDGELNKKAITKQIDEEIATGNCDYVEEIADNFERVIEDLREPLNQ